MDTAGRHTITATPRERHLRSNTHRVTPQGHPSRRTAEIVVVALVGAGLMAAFRGVVVELASVLSQLGEAL